MATHMHTAYSDRVANQKVLLDGVTAVDFGVWFRVQKQRPVTITVEGEFVATIQFYGSCAHEAPADTDSNRPPLGPAYTTPDSFIVDAAYEWIKAEVTEYTSGAVFAYCVVGG